MTKGFKTAGFIYLKNHSIPPEIVETLFSTSRDFFARSQEQKNRFAWGMSGKSSSPGYTAYGGEKLTQSLDQAEIDDLRSTNPDMKEAFDVGLERVEGGENNIWPGEIGDEMVQTKLHMQDVFARCRGLQVEVMRAIALGMGLQEKYFDDCISEGDNTLRCLHYPPAKKELFENGKGSIRAGAHSDYGIS
jgi:isopenicillin N synthase-like dioxygenase